MLKLNNLSAKVFDAKDTDNAKVKLNGINGTTKELSRQDIITTGRLVACEHFGNIYNNSAKKGEEKYNSRIAEMGVDYATLAQAHKEKKLLFCASLANKAVGKEAPANFEEFKKNSISYANNQTFLATLAAIDRDVLTPLFFSVLDSVGMDLMQWESSALGATKEITVKSNDVFIFEDGAFGSERSTSKNYLYAKTVTLTPKMYTCNATIKFYQDLVNGDAGEYYAAIMLGMYNKIYSIAIKGMKAAVAGNYIPSGLTASTYTTANWIRITDLVAAANGVSVNNLMAIGTRSALANLLPVDSTGGAITGLQYGLGEEWFENGHLAKAGQVDLFPVSPVIVPGTQNSSLQTIDTGNDIYVLAKGGYRPMVGVYAEGSPIMLTATPSGNGVNSYGTADATIDINVGAMFDIKPVFASKVGVVTSVYPTTGE